MSSLVNLDTFGGNLNVMVFGATGGIGQALTRNLAANQNIDSVFAESARQFGWWDVSVPDGEGWKPLFQSG